MNSDGTPFHGCPRYLLERAYAELKNLGFELKIGYTFTFQLLDSKTYLPEEFNFSNNLEAMVQKS